MQWLLIQINTMILNILINIQCLLINIKCQW